MTIHRHARGLARVAPSTAGEGTPQVVGRAWTARALCRDHPTLPASAWDATVLDDRSRTRRAARIAAAQATCAVCPVAAPCDAEALEGYGGGVRAGVVHPDRSSHRSPDARTGVPQPRDGAA